MKSRLVQVVHVFAFETSGLTALGLLVLSMVGITNELRLEVGVARGTAFSSTFYLLIGFMILGLAWLAQMQWLAVRAARRKQLVVVGTVVFLPAFVIANKAVVSLFDVLAVTNLKLWGLFT